MCKHSMFFAHWSSSESSYRDMERRELFCERCGENTQHTFRFHTTKTKHYSVVSVGEGERTVTLICHGCLLESAIEKSAVQELIFEYDKEIAVGEAYHYMENGDNKNAEKKLKKVLKRDPKYSQAVYAMGKCLISQTRYSEAEFFVKNLEIDFPDNNEVEDLRRLMPNPKFENIQSSTQSTSLNDLQIDHLVRDKVSLISKLQENKFGDFDKLEKIKKLLIEDSTFTQDSNDYLEEKYEEYKNSK